MIAPCRFCGSAPNTITRLSDGFIQMSCECGTTGPWLPSRAEARVVWSDMMASDTRRTLRDEFAQAAIMGLMTMVDTTTHNVSKKAYELADAMLAAREKEPSK